MGAALTAGMSIPTLIPSSSAGVRLAVATAISCLALASAALAQSPPTGQALGPQNFAVDISVSPDVTVPKIDQASAMKYCTITGQPVDGTRLPCTVPTTITSSTKVYKGTATQIGGALKGSFELVCDFKLDATVAVDAVLGPNFVPKAIELRSITGSSPFNCSWNLDFGKDGVLAGTTEGTISLSRVEGQQKFAPLIKQTVSVVSGSGTFERAAGGTGSFDVYQEVVWNSSATAPRAQASAAPADAGKMGLTVKAGKPTAKLVKLSGAIASTDKRLLRVVTTPGASCSAKATKGSTTTSLGSARDSDKNGEVRFTGALGAKLKKTGTWKATVTCAYRKSGKTIKLPTARATITRS